MKDVAAAKAAAKVFNSSFFPANQSTPRKGGCTERVDSVQDMGDEVESTGKPAHSKA